MTAAPLFAPVLPPGTSPRSPAARRRRERWRRAVRRAAGGRAAGSGGGRAARRPAGSACAGPRSGSHRQLRTAAGGARGAAKPCRPESRPHARSRGHSRSAAAHICARHPGGSAFVRFPADGEYAARPARGGFDRAGGGCAGPAPTARLVRSRPAHPGAARTRRARSRTRQRLQARAAGRSPRQGTRFAARTLRSSRRPPALPDRALTSRWRTIKSGSSRMEAPEGSRRPLRAGRDRAPTSTWLRSSPK